tara:strand:+ start:301 stop:984 length:684 start_codon:yes stop_codon:yes gene_type:complete
MATVDQVINTFRTYIDEPDQTFVPDSLVENMLNLAYIEFRRKVTNIDPNIYARTVDIAAPGATQVDLTTVPLAAAPLLGPNAQPEDRLISLLSVYIVDQTNNLPSLVFNSVQSLEALQSTGDAVFFTNNILMFNYVIQRPLKIAYVPGHNVQFQAGIAGQFIDDLDAFHDMIALYAYKQYAIADAATSEQIMMQLQVRERELIDYLSNRNTAGANYVQDVTSNFYWY